jgi:misacylated tRNA(Ala) deacylase
LIKITFAQNFPDPVLASHFPGCFFSLVKEPGTRGLAHPIPGVPEIANPRVPCPANGKAVIALSKTVTPSEDPGMTEAIFEIDAYQKDCRAKVVELDSEGIVLDRTVFYPVGGGQPGDTGWLQWADGQRLQLTGTRKREDGGILHLAEADQPWPETGTEVQAILDWDLRYIHMRMHTCMHLLGVVLPHGVTGGNITAKRSRLDFDMEEPVDKDGVNQQLNELIQAGHPVSTIWITGEELAAQPELIRTLSAAPPKDAGRIRLLKISDLDLQPCAGTHVRNTAEIGFASVVKTEKKGRHNRRVHLELAEHE